MIKIQNSKEKKNKPTKTGTMATVANAIAIKRICHDCHLNLAKKGFNVDNITNTKSSCSLNMDGWDVR